MKKCLGFVIPRESPTGPCMVLQLSVIWQKALIDLFSDVLGLIPKQPQSGNNAPFGFADEHQGPDF